MGFRVSIKVNYFDKNLWGAGGGSKMKSGFPKMYTIMFYAIYMLRLKRLPRK